MSYNEFLVQYKDVENIKFYRTCRLLLDFNI